MKAFARRARECLIDLSTPPTGRPVNLFVDDPVLGLELKPAAVLVAFIDRPAGPQLLLTVRAAELAQHAGQVGFPGGRIDPEDASPAAAAARELEEELAVPASLFEPWGYGDPFATSSGYRITPVIGALPADIDPVPSPVEVADFFEIGWYSLPGLTDWPVTPVVFAGRERPLLDASINGRRIWGATAGMLRDLQARFEEPF